MTSEQIIPVRTTTTERLFVRATANGHIHRRYRVVESGDWVSLNPTHSDFADADSIIHDDDVADLANTHPGMFCSWCFPRSFRWLFSLAPLTPNP